MTKEQAIEYLKADIKHWQNTSVSTEHLEMAIKSLEQQPSEDCISRQMIIGGIDAIREHHGGILDVRLIATQLPSVTPTQSWIPLVWDEYPTVDSDGNDDYVYAVDYSVPMPKEDEWVLVTDEDHNVVKVQYDGYDFGDYGRENILAWSPLPKPYEE